MDDGERPGEIDVKECVSSSLLVSAEELAARPGSASFTTEQQEGPLKPWHACTWHAGGAVGLRVADRGGASGVWPVTSSDLPSQPRGRVRWTTPSETDKVWSEQDHKPRHASRRTFRFLFGGLLNRGHVFGCHGPREIRLAN